MNNGIVVLLIAFLLSHSLYGKENSLLGISGQGLVPEKITEILGVSPAEKGSDSDENDRAYVSFWNYHVPSNKKGFHEHLAYWVNFVEKHEKELAEIFKLKTSVGEVRISLAFNTEFLMLSPAEMAFFAKHRIHVQSRSPDFKSD